MSIFLKNVNWSVVCNGHAVGQHVVMAVAIKITLFGDITPGSQSTANRSSSEMLEHSRKHSVFNQKTVNFRDAVIFVW
jgi:hypothetical protein